MKRRSFLNIAISVPAGVTAANVLAACGAEDSAQTDQYPQIVVVSKMVGNGISLTGAIIDKSSQPRDVPHNFTETVMALSGVVTNDRSKRQLQIYRDSTTGEFGSGFTAPQERTQKVARMLEAAYGGVLGPWQLFGGDVPVPGSGTWHGGMDADPTLGDVVDLVDYSNDPDGVVRQAGPEALAALIGTAFELTRTPMNADDPTGPAQYVLAPVRQ